MANSLEEAKIQLENLESTCNEMYEHIKFENQCSCAKAIKHNCVKNNCPNYAIMEHEGIKFNMCKDDWSLSRSGWHEIYGETIDLCVENNKCLKEK